MLLILSASKTVGADHDEMATTAVIVALAALKPCSHKALRVSACNRTSTGARQWTQIACVVCLAGAGRLEKAR